MSDGADVSVECPVCQNAKVHMRLDSDTDGGGREIVDIIETWGDCECREYLASLDHREAQKGRYPYFADNYDDSLLDSALYKL